MCVVITSIQVEVNTARMLRDTLVVGMAIYALGCERVCVVITSIQVEVNTARMLRDTLVTGG